MNAVNFLPSPALARFEDVNLTKFGSGQLPKSKKRRNQRNNQRNENQLNLEAHRAGTVVDVDSLAPRVLAVYMTTVEVHIRCLVRVGNCVLAG